MRNITGAIAVLEGYKEMKTRTLAAAALLPVLLVVVLLTPEWVTAVFVGIMAAIAAHELLRGTKLVQHPRLITYSMLMAALVPVWSYLGCNHTAALLGALVCYILLFAEMMAVYPKLPFAQIAMCVVAAMLIPYMLSALVRILVMENGRYYILMPFAAAFLSDTGAYFAGVFLGKHKLAPLISPKKTVEGLIGGFAAAILGMVIYGVVLQVAFDFEVNYLFALIYGLLGSACGVFGDLSFSVVKRQTGIKDYGNLIPGHGGVLDRFDSVIVVAPLVETLLVLIPMAV